MIEIFRDVKLNSNQVIWDQDRKPCYRRLRMIANLFTIDSANSSCISGGKRPLFWIVVNDQIRVVGI